MKEKLIKLLKTKGSVNFTDLPKLMPEIKGDYTMYLPLGKNGNPNIILVDKVRSEFIEEFNEVKGKIDLNLESVFSLMFDNSTVYSNMPIASKSDTRGTRECWLPSSLSLKQ
jgi:hypothetical protein